MKNRLTSYLIEFSKVKLTRPASDKVRVAEIIAVVITAIGKFIFVDYLNWRLPYVVITILAWLFYVIWRYKRDSLILKDWGFRTDNFKQVIKLILPFALFSILSFIIIGYYKETINITWHILPLLITYPIWGTVQQFLTIALVAGNLNEIKRIKLSKSAIILLTAILFSIVHYPSIWLMLGTFILALFYGYVYLTHKNIYVLGLLHGWLGTLFYYTVVNQDPFADVFMKYL